MGARAFRGGKRLAFAKYDLTTGQVAEACGVSPRTVTKWVDRGLIPGTYRIPAPPAPYANGRTVGGDRRIPARACIAFLETMGHAEAIRRLRHATSLILTAVGLRQEDLERLKAALADFSPSINPCRCLFEAGILMTAERCHALLIDVSAVGATAAAAASRSALAMEHRPLSIGIFHPDDQPSTEDYSACFWADAEMIDKVAAYLEEQI